MRTQVLEDGEVPAAPQASADATAADAGLCFSCALGAAVPDAACAQSVTNSGWYRCAAGTGWLPQTSPEEDTRGACTVEHAL